MKKKFFLFLVILGLGVFQGLASDGQIEVCVTTDKNAPINGERDIHAWVKNFGSTPLSGAILRFFIEDKGTDVHNVSLAPQGELKKTRRVSWATTGKRKISAMLQLADGTQILVNGSITIFLTRPEYQSELIVVCSNGNHYRESELFQRPPGPELAAPPLPLRVCVSNGKNPPVYGNRDIHAWITNEGQYNISGLKLYFAVEGKGTETYDIPDLLPNRTWKKTRNLSWSSSGTKTITAMVLSADGKSRILVEGKFKVSALGAPTSSAGQNVVCSDHTVKKESDM
ncbi:MAG: hypothetical protein ACYDH0_02770 [Candidatus Aminicenantales bacterium]